MANIMDYLDWRGDLTLAQAPFNEVDNLILAELSFLDFGGIVPGPGEGRSVSLRTAAELFFARQPVGEEIDMGVLVPNEIPEMLQKLGKCERFRHMKLNCFADYLDTEKAEQFAALTIETGDGALYLSFRGTDDTLAGWKEDFLLTCMSEIPAQREAIAYTAAVAEQYPRRKLRLGGHSKGGNLAVWSGVYQSASVQRRILNIWSNDGPGFHDDILSTPQYKQVENRVVSIVPKSSVVGMLLEHMEDYVVVESTQIGLMQHDGFSWQVMGDHFLKLREVSRHSRHSDMVLRDWVQRMPLDQREKFVDAMFDVLTASGAETLTDLKDEKLKTAGAMIRAMKDMEKDTRDALGYAIKQLFESNMKVFWGELQQEAEKIQEKRERDRK